LPSSAAHAAQLRQVELEADHEHQEHDAEFGEVADRVRVLRERHRIRADQNSDREVAEHRRQAREAAGHRAGDRGNQEQQHQFERRSHARGGSARRASSRVSGNPRIGRS
jgi:hypothetical protein